MFRDRTECTSAKRRTIKRRTVHINLVKATDKCPIEPSLRHTRSRTVRPVMQFDTHTHRPGWVNAAVDYRYECQPLRYRSVAFGYSSLVVSRTVRAGDRQLILWECLWMQWRYTLGIYNENEGGRKTTGEELQWDMKLRTPYCDAIQVNSWTFSNRNRVPHRLNLNEQTIKTNGISEFFRVSILSANRTTIEWIGQKSNSEKKTRW